jgi:hypothetical protein
MNAAPYWKTALLYYLKVSFLYSAIGWAPPLAITLVDAIWTGITKHRLAINRTGMEFAMAFGCFFFLLFLLRALGDDIHRNRGVQEPIVAWNPLRMWKTFT